MVPGLVLAALEAGRRGYWVCDSLLMGCQGGSWGLLGLGCRDGGCSPSKDVMVTSLAIAMKLLVFSWVPPESTATDKTFHFISFSCLIFLVNILSTILE